MPVYLILISLFGIGFNGNFAATALAVFNI